MQDDASFGSGGKVAARQPAGMASGVRLFRTSRTLALALLLAAATYLVYAPALLNGFVFDDGEYILGNRALQNGLTRASVAWAFTSSYVANWHPLTWLSHLLDVSLFGLKPWGHHLTSILIHATSAALLVRVLAAMTGALGKSAFVAAIFALHPLHVESVAWVAERKDVLSALCFFLTLGAYQRYARYPEPRRYLAVLALAALGLTAKPMLVTLPFVLLLLDLWPLGRLGAATRTGAGTGLSPARVLAEKVPLLALSAASGAATILAHRAGEAIKDVPLGARLTNAVHSVVAYLGTMFWPIDLSYYYPLYPLREPKPWTTLLAVLALVGIGVAAVGFFRRRPWIATGWLWYLVMLLPVIGLVQVGFQARADRYTYLPLVGATLLLAWGVPESLRRFSWANRLSAVGAVATCLVCGTLTVRQVGYWRDEYTLNSHALEVTTDNWMAHDGLAAELRRLGRLGEAVSHAEAVVRLIPGYAGGYLKLGSLLQDLGRHRDAIVAFERALSLASGEDAARAREGLFSSLRALGSTRDAATPRIPGQAGH